MKIDFRQMLIVGFMWLLSFVLLMWVFSLQGCSSSYHLNKFYKKGGKIEDKKVQVFVHDTIQINGRDSIIEKSIFVDCPEPKAPPTRYEIRYKYKTLRDSFETIRYVTKIQYKERVRTLKTDVKTNPLRQIKSFILWGVLIVILLFVFNWISKR
jgi:hypothetical protein